VGGPLCPCVVIRSKEAPLVLNYAKTNIRPNATITLQHTIVGIKPPPIVASYASRGPLPSFPSILKLDIMAPGSLVLGAWMPEIPVGQFRSDVYYIDHYIWHGTSGACPHVAGVTALLKRMHPDWSPAAIKSAIMTTANPFDNSFKPIRDNGNKLKLFASPLAMGAGQIQPNHALDPGLVYDATPQDYVNLLCSRNLDTTQIRAIVGSEHDCKTPSFDLNYPSFVVLYCDDVMMREQEFHRIVTNVGQGAATYNAW
jgi:subtilisin family serine protease